MKSVFFYRPEYVTAPENLHIPGVKRFSHYFRVYNGSVPLDRTGTISLPIHTSIAFPVPELRPFTQTYEDICNERAREILRHAESKNLPIRVLYSGGIDSTTVLVSLLKNATKEQREKITVLLTENSILENPNFFREHILGKLNFASSEHFKYLLGAEAVFLSGEHNDQVFGSDIIGNFMKIVGDEHIHKPYTRGMVLKLFNTIAPDSENNEFLLTLFEKLAQNAPVPIDTNYQLFWWINFAMKWHTVYFRQLAFTSRRNAHLINKEYINQYFFTFFNTEEFQLWSMNNPDKKMKDTWNTYKWVAKELIYEYTKDADYRDNKLKVGSLASILKYNTAFNFIDDSYQLVNDIAPDELYNHNNSFVD